RLDEERDHAAGGVGERREVGVEADGGVLGEAGLEEGVLTRSDGEAVGGGGGGHGGGVPGLDAAAGEDEEGGGAAGEEAEGHRGWGGLACPKIGAGGGPFRRLRGPFRRLGGPPGPLDLPFRRLGGPFRRLDLPL